MKKIIAVAFFCLGLSLNAQNIGNSPYAAFGIGDVKYDNTIENTAMGGISTAFINDFNSSFNFKNPAANENLELTSFKFEVSNENNFFKSGLNGQKVDKKSTYLSNLSLSFPLSPKVKFGLGYQPYSSKRYNLLVKENLTNDIVRANNFHGEGTLNTVQTAVSYQLNSQFGLGLRTNFIFGNVSDIDEMTYSNAELINGHETKLKVGTFNFTLGATYQKKYKDDRRLTFGATTTLGNTGNMTSTYTNSTYYYTTGNTKNYESIIEQKSNKTKNLIPMEFSLGGGYGELGKWLLAGQIDYKKGETIQYLGNNFQYKDSYRFSAGGWILPNANNFRNYFSRVIYRYGAYYEKGNLNINGKNINEFAATFGATFPFKSSSINRMSGFDLAVEIGKRGTTKNNLINQNFINLKIGINFADKWFRKTLYE